MQNRRFIEIVTVCGIFVTVLLASALGVGARDMGAYDLNDVRMAIRAMQDSLAMGDSLSVKDSLPVRDSVSAVDTLVTADSLEMADSLHSRDSVHHRDTTRSQRMMDSRRSVGGRPPQGGQQTRQPGARPPQGGDPRGGDYRNGDPRKGDPRNGDPRYRNMNPNDPNYQMMMRRDSSMRMRDSLGLAGGQSMLAEVDSSAIKDSLKYEARMQKRKQRDSLKRAKDSIRWAAPRILETNFVPDSMQYKRLISWNVGLYSNEYKPIDVDSTYNDWYSEYPFFHEDVDVTYLGTVGSPTQNVNFLKRREFDDFKAYAPYTVYSYTPEDLPFYNTKSPYTELAYWGNVLAYKDKEELNVRLLLTQNITQQWNVGFLLERWSAAGTLANEKTANNSVVLTTNYLGKHYVANLGYIHQNVNRQENGGVQDSYMVKDTTIDAKTIPITLNNANNKLSRNTVFIDHSYTFSLKKKTPQVDSLEMEQPQEPDMAVEDMVVEDAVAVSSKADPSLTLGHMAELSRYYRLYTDNIGLNDKVGRAFYNDMFYINPVQSADSTRVLMLDNRLFFKLQPWSMDAVVSDIYGGVGYNWKNIYGFQPDMFLTGTRNINHYDLYAYAGVNGQFRKYLKWGADARYSFMGDYVNDMDINAHLDVSFYPFADKYEPVILSGRFQTSLKEPDWYSKHYYSNHYVWNNENFGKTSNTEIEASLRIPKWNMEASFGYALVDNYLYNDTLGIVRQNDGLINVMTGYLQKNFKLWIFRFDHRVLFQYSSNKEVLPLPMFTFHFRYYIEFTAVKNVLDMQIGADATFNTKYYAPAYNPALGTFQLQNREMIGNNPYIDVFLNLQWKRLSVFLKVVNVGQGWPNGDVFSAYHYVRPFRIFKLGIHWPFVIQ